MQKFKQYQTYYLFEGIKDNKLSPYGVWIKGDMIEAKCLEDAQRRCGQLYGLGGRFYDSYLKVEEVK